MQAIQFDRFGTTSELHLAEVDVPQVGPDQVRIRVRAAGVNALDGKIRSGSMTAITTAFPSIPGFEVAGVVDAIGDGVEDIAVGDEVFGWSSTGGYAEYALAAVGEIAVKPAELPWEQAVSLPIAGATAERVLDLLEVTAGETVLLHGAAGAVGTIAVQLAAARGARVIATAGQGNQLYLASLGATATLYGDGLVDRVEQLAPDGVDAVFDLAGKGALEDSITLRGGTDRIATIADFRAHELGITFVSGPTPRSPRRLAELARDAADGSLITTVTTYPLEQAAAAQDASDGGHTRGKLALTIA
ncbi:NADPH:quinone reductase [Williamsia sp. Leaf354]|uniref:NADP-dependent oxidoreductase n=1 Tax=Williamsia sp. Leaf354 TaxID=1736349 RepID=UPI0006F4EFD2|nr:NADP-dependent oxidoreductase [Williamsia sp. Leaf354]KQR99745.1 NADPH:quinone reductase [Williamsia sp. Leaf354]